MVKSGAIFGQMCYLKFCFSIRVSYIYSSLRSVQEKLFIHFRCRVVFDSTAKMNIYHIMTIIFAEMYIDKIITDILQETSAFTNY